MIANARRTRRLIRSGFLWIATLLALPGFAGAFDRVLIVSIDALHPDALSRADAPALQGLIQSGTYTLRGRSVDPPKTLVAHTAMFTGLAPEVSGKRDNDWKPEEPRVQLPTLFDDAKALDFHTAFFYAKPKLGYLVNGRLRARRA
jgi:predicted AlkP superfamily pyrophosphatase or phosphodiesterase